MKRNHTSSAALALAGALLAGLAVPNAQAQVYVTKFGFFDPTGGVNDPFSCIQGLDCEVQNNPTVMLGAGTYREHPTLQTPMVLQPTTTPVTIGDVGTSTTFSVVTYNCHLFGHETTIPGLPRWNDGTRALYIGQVVGTGQPDVVALEEVWDSNYWNTITSFLGYPSGFYAGRVGSFPRVLGSGLAVYSQTTIQNPLQVDYTSSDTGSTDSLATKGFTQSTISKDGFTIGFFSTHTQSGTSSGNISARADQLNQLAVAVLVYRTLNPTQPVIVVGDFNVMGELPEYVITMQSTMWGSARVKDGFRNLLCTPDPHCTSCRTNDLNLYFNPSSVDQRIDYVLYANSWDGSVEIVPTQYDRREFQVPPQFPAISGDGLTTRDLSDHYGVFMQFELHR